MTEHLLRRALLAPLLLLALSCGPAVPGPDDKLPALPADPFAGLQPLGPDDQTQSPVLRPGPKPPPSVSRRLALAFPPPPAPRQQAPAPPAGPLQVLRHQPADDQGLVGAVTVTFNQPMVPVSDLNTVAAAATPLEIAPRVPGRYRWLGSRTLAFEPDGRMPFGTAFTARVPAGTAALSGARLAEEVRWSFSTPRPRLVEALPRRYAKQVEPGALIALRFNQAVTTAEVLARLKTVPQGISLQPVPEKEWGELPGVGATVVSWEPERTVVLRPTAPLAKNTRHTLRLTRGLRGEGPLATTADLLHTFYTYGPLSVEEARCNERRCGPEYGLRLTFSNPLSVEKPEKFVAVSPAPADLEVKAAGRSLLLLGSFAARTRLRLTVKPGISDIHGQRLAQKSEHTLTTGDIRPALSFAARDHAVLELRGPRTVPLQVSGVSSARLRMVRVAREQLWKVLENAQFSHDRGGTVDPLQGIRGRLPPRTLRTGLGPNQRGTVALSTDRGLGRGRPGVLYLELKAEELRRQSALANPYRGLVVTVTDLGLMARYDHDRIVALVSRLSGGKPLGKVALELRDRTGKVLWQGQSDAQGLAELPGRRALKAQAPYVLWAQKGRDSTFVVLDGRGVGQAPCSSYNAWGHPPARARLKLFVFTDRDPYRPGETVHLRGVLREEETAPRGGISAVRLDRVAVTITSPRGRKVLEREQIPVTDAGAFSLDFEVPEGADLGRYQVYARTDQGTGHGTFQVQAYRAPEFSLAVRRRGEGPLFFGDALAATVEADYLFGAPLAEAPLRWTLRRAPARYRPPKNPGFAFGQPPRFGFGWARYPGGWPGRVLEQRGAAGEIVARGSGKTDAEGRFALEAALAAAEKEPPRRPAAFTLEAEVSDPGRQAIAGRTTVTVHPAARYIGLRPERSLVPAGDALAVQAVLTDVAGARIAGKGLTLRAVEQKHRARPEKRDGVWRYRHDTEEVEVGSCTLQSAAEPASCQLTLPRPGAYLVRAEVKDAGGRLARSAVRVYAHGPGVVAWRTENPERVELVPDKERYAPGETARILVKSPLRDAVGLLTLSRGGMISHRRIRVEGSSKLLEVPIPAEALPELHLGIALARGRQKVAGPAAAARDLGLPALAHGSVRLPVSLAQKRITVTVSPERATVRPGGSLALTLQTRDASGAPSPAEVTLIGVDEGVLSLLQYQTPDPLPFFFARRAAETALQDTRPRLLRREPPRPATTPPRAGNGGKSLLFGFDVARSQRKLAPAGAAPGASAELERKPAEPSPAAQQALAIRSRSHFASTAFYHPAVLTDEAGRATLTVTLPDNLTTFRVMAVALDRGQLDRFGRGEGQITVRKALLLRPALPRFLSLGDRVEAAVVVHNETGADGVADVLLRGRNVRLDGPARRRVTVPAGRAVEVRFPLEPKAPGPARLQFAALLKSPKKPLHSDAVELSLPVLLPATAEAFATYGVTEASLAQPVAPPAGALPGHGGLQISLSSTALTGLEDAVSYLLDYPHGCTEQTASRALPIFSLGKMLEDFALAQVSDRARQQALASAALGKLLAAQRGDGGWGMWSGSRRSSVYLSAYALFTLLRAQEAGHAPPAEALQRAGRYLQRALDHPLTTLGLRHSLTTQTLAAWALTDLGEKPLGQLGRLFGARKDLPLFARALLMQSLARSEGPSPRVKTLLAELDAAAVQSAGGVHFAEQTSESLRLLMHSDDRTDAMVLSALLEAAPDHPLLPKVARGLLSARVKGRWSTTQANAFALVALARYYKQVEKTPPDYVARLWLGEEGYLGQAAFRGRQMAVVHKTVPLDELREAGPSPLILAKSGPGKLYYRIGLRYAPGELRLSAAEQGLSVSRSYEPLEPGDTSVQRGADGTWQVQAGATVRVRLTLVVPDQRYYVALEDPLPAGLEPVNLGFATSAQSALGNQGKARLYDVRSFHALLAFDHRELRDQSALFYADRLPPGVYEVTYLARATALGRFIAAPPRAEEMYHPETFGRGATAVVTVQANRNTDGR